MGVAPENIVLADLEEHIMPNGFARHIFDASSCDWPDFGTRFDFVIYPESFSIINSHYEDFENGMNPKVTGINYGYTEEDYFRIFEGAEFCNEVFKIVSPALSGTWHLIQNGLEQLKPGGELRASLVGPHAIKEQEPYRQLEYLREHLHRQFGATIKNGEILKVMLPK
ncbi:hypothetical protein IPG41_02090 [Candidatus Peregrinibacteria bacterium]|nr:MAG: hypothetical protein IPG41_02090 [Candidatus Peregrinibacteria bacterium]